MSSYIGKININNTEYPIAQSLFGTCNTTANTATKVVTCADFDTLISGIVINVYFTYANTESSISLNVNSTGNKTVYVDSNSSILWDAGATKSFVYYNNQWRLINPTSVGTTYSAATTAAAGLMSATDKTKLDGLSGQYVPIQVTGWMSTSAINSSGEVLSLGTSSTWSGVDQILNFQQGQYSRITLSNIFSAIDEASIQMGTSDRDTYINASVDYTGSGSCVGHSSANISSGGIALQSNNIELEVGNSSSSTAPYSLIEAKLVGDTADVINLYSNKGGINIFGGQGVSIGSRTTSGVIISELQDPTNPQDAANKRYVDNSIASIPASTYAAGSGLSLSGTTFNHTNSITASSVGSSVATSGATLDVPYAKYDAQGHITAKGTHVHTIGSLAASAITSGTFATARIPNLPTSIITSGTFATARIPSLPASIITSGTLGTAILPTVPVAKGGTGATTAAAARTNLGLGSAAVASTSASVDNNSNLPTGSAIQSYVTGLGYEANQNAFSNVVIGSSTVAADQKTDTLTLTGAGSVTLSANTSTDTITITGTDTTYGSATTAAAGLMSASDKIKLNGLSEEYVPIQVTGEGWQTGSGVTSTILNKHESRQQDLTLIERKFSNSDQNLYQQSSIKFYDTYWGQFNIGIQTTASDNYRDTGLSLQPGFSSYLYYRGDVGNSQVQFNQQYISIINNDYISNINNSIELGGNTNGITIASDDSVSIGTSTTSGVHITQVADPTNDEDAANKRYVDNAIASGTSSTGTLRGVRILSTDSSVTPIGSSTTAYIVNHGLGINEFTESVLVSTGTTVYNRAVLGNDNIIGLNSSELIHYSITNITEDSFNIYFDTAPSTFKILLNVNYADLDFINGDNLSYGGGS